MTLDPQAKVYLDLLAAANVPPLSTLTPKQAKLAMATKPAEVGPAEAVARTEDRSIPAATGDVPVRIYWPSEDANLPCLIYLHGGGFVLGDIDKDDVLCRHLANAVGCVVINVGYRLAPEHKHPAAADDAFAVLQWVMTHGSGIGVDVKRVVISGASAGGNLATVACLMSRDRGKPLPARQVLIYPVTDCEFDSPSHREFAEGYLLTHEAMLWFWNHYIPNDEVARHPYASPIKADSLAGLPPALLITGGCDPLRDEGEAYAAKMQASGVEVTLHRYDGMIHGFFSKKALFGKAKQAQRDVVTELRRVFRL